MSRQELGYALGSLNDSGQPRRYDLGIAGGHEPITTLRGAGVEVDSRRVGQLVVGLALAALVVVVVVLFVAGFHKNAQITDLRRHGVVVEVTVSGCLGLMGGSGSNLVGYDCRGTFTIDGHRYNEAIPGNTLHAPGATLRDVTVPGDPALLSTVHDVTTVHPSRRVFILPTILLVVLALAAGALGLRRRHAPPASPVVLRTCRPR